MKLVVGVACAAALVAGCRTGTVEGEAQPASGITEPTYSPCDDIPDEALVAVGVDPATESRDIQGVSIPGWKVCRWTSSGHFLSVYSTMHTLEDVRRDPQNEEFADIAVGQRPAVQFRLVSDVRRSGCDVAMESAGGTVIVSVTEGKIPLPDPCEVARDAALGMMSWIPE
ncbi:DUF3558 domain-containing protein [Rhodococcus triatomae]|nr:hypothetical protein G419_05642 [Rhodococcus triatomae BKS 15-14]